MEPQALADELILRLNALLVDDAMKKALYQLTMTRVEVEPRLANHATIQMDVDDGKIRMGWLGLLNGLVGCLGKEDGALEGWGYILVQIDEEGERVIGFSRTQELARG